MGRTTQFVILIRRRLTGVGGRFWFRWLGEGVGASRCRGGGVAELVGLELERGFAARGGPEFFTPFDAAADLFDRRFDVAAGDWQAHPAHDVVCESAQKMMKPEIRRKSQIRRFKREL